MLGSAETLRRMVRGVDLGTSVFKYAVEENGQAKEIGMEWQKGVRGTLGQKCCLDQDMLL
jgi:hypothetical protein